MVDKVAGTESSKKRARVSKSEMWPLEGMGPKDGGKKCPNNKNQKR